MPPSLPNYLPVFGIRGGLGIDIEVPVALLLAQELPPAAKLVWMLCRLHTEASPPYQSKLAAQSGLSLPTVRAALARAATIPAPPEFPAHHAVLPGSLLTDPHLTPVAKVLYGIFQSQGGEFTYPALNQLTGIGPNTLKRAVTALVQSEWLETEQHNRLAPVRFTLRNPLVTRQQLEVELAARRLQHDPNKGEALMKEYLSLLVGSHDFEDNARPGWLINPKTSERLELDRFYISAAAFEYNGAPHFGTSEQATDQQTRDLVKVGICALRHIPVVIIHSEDLSLPAMRAKVGQLLPLRDLTGHEPLVAFLERRARRYREDGAP